MGGIFPVGNKASETRIYIACLLLVIIFILKILTCTRCHAFHFIFTGHYIGLGLLNCQKTLHPDILTS